MSRFIQQKFAIKYPSCQKPNKGKKIFGPQFFPEGRPQLFYGWLLAQFTVHCIAKCGFPFADLHLQKPGNEIECRIYGGWVKMVVQFEAVW